MKLKNKVCIITGSSRGIGAQIARAYAKEGAKVVLTYLSRKKEAEDLSKEIEASLIFKLDVRDKNQIKEVFENVKQKLGNIDVLVNNAGVNKTNDFDKLTEEEWDLVLDVDLKGVFLCCQQV